MLVKMTVEAALGAEMEEHILDTLRINSVIQAIAVMATPPKPLKGDHGEINLSVPRDRSNSFEPTIVKKGETRLTQMDDQILSLYAKGMSTQDIVDITFQLFMVNRVDG